MGRKTRAVLGFALVWLLFVGAAPRSAAGGEPFSGTFTAEAVRPPECTSPVGFCTRGLLLDRSGRPVATYDFTMLTNEPSGDGTRFTFTGESVITKMAAPWGIMTAEDHGDIEFRAPGTSPFTTHVRITGGTGAYSRAAGHLVATGELDMATGSTEGTYTGTVTRSP